MVQINNVLLWRMYIEFEVAQSVAGTNEGMSTVQAVYYRALEVNPSAKIIYIDAVRSNPYALQEVSGCCCCCLASVITFFIDCGYHARERAASSHTHRGSRPDRRRVNNTMQYNTIQYSNSQLILRFSKPQDSLPEFLFRHSASSAFYHVSA